MSSINNARNLQILQKNKEIKNLKNGEKKWPDTGIHTYYSASGYGSINNSEGRIGKLDHKLQKP